jgi:hypothetical protein
MPWLRTTTKNISETQINDGLKRELYRTHEQELYLFTYFFIHSFLVSLKAFSIAKVT